MRLVPFLMVIVLSGCDLSENDRSRLRVAPHTDAEYHQISDGGLRLFCHDSIAAMCPHVEAIQDIYNEVADCAGFSVPWIKPPHVTLYDKYHLFDGVDVDADLVYVTGYYTEGTGMVHAKYGSSDYYKKVLKHEFIHYFQDVWGATDEEFFNHKDVLFETCDALPAGR